MIAWLKDRARAVRAGLVGIVPAMITMVIVMVVLRLLGLPAGDAEMLASFMAGAASESARRNGKGDS